MIRAILFDFDGTLTHPGQLDFVSLKAEIGCPPDETVLEFIEAIADREERSSVEATLHRFEERAAELSEPNPDAETLLTLLKSHRIPFGILTRNTRRSVTRTLRNFSSIEVQDFGVILCRDDGFDPKPSPEGVRQAARFLGVDFADLLMVGDHWLDISAGYNAGAKTAFLTNQTGVPPVDPTPDYVFGSLKELATLVRGCSTG